MCGIIGYTGPRPTAEVLLRGLERLEYRGYDSAGLAILDGGVVRAVKVVGRVERLKERVAVEGPAGGLAGIGHTRWATHGEPSERNAHPHLDCYQRIAVVHNGILENHGELRRWLESEGHRFRSETDTEVLAHLVEHAFEGDLEEAVRAALQRVEGSYAVAVVAAHDPDAVVAARHESPLVVGLGKGENWVASDIPTLSTFTGNMLVLEDGEVASIHPDRVRVRTLDGRGVERPIFRVEWQAERSLKGAFDDYMLKEIHEQPEALGRLLEPLRGPGAPGRAPLGRGARNGSRTLPNGRGTSEAQVAGLRWLPELPTNVDEVWFVACGTAYHAARLAASYTDELADLPSRAELASEFRYGQPRVGPRSLVVVISQSGETADTLGALREAQRLGAPTVAVVNVEGSTIGREADQVLPLRAGDEIAVASTKAFTAQVVAGLLLALRLGQARGVLRPERSGGILEGLRLLPEQVAAMLAVQEARMQELATRWRDRRDLFFIGRGRDLAVAMEGQLKLKEISYLHAEALAGGELKHGTLSLITEGVPVVGLATQPDLAVKMAGNLQETRSRGAEVLVVVGPEAEGVTELAFMSVVLPQGVDPLLRPVLAVVPLQLLAYAVAKGRGLDVDKPRNLAKSVTVE
ncbi:glutamine--fructose-6-phosphate transaminase (isomerizing) [Limnochorda pilosa]|uniref:Glutamine--fructose-6-phosphate aminotransferase [isomerizing] n=1 Tax=Limnochorda pilosa TaxID=1555112 RepID=A0A0K2SPA9_LIMPI|nr:glutamine--fructose-6-phosphate transaminase (isomerizing) [Limnochorda pilosa]BAS28837.1 glutamine amidotransferase [Limnochorda pilosa]